MLENARDGKAQAAGGLFATMMQSTGGKAYWARVRELVLERAQAPV